MDHHAHTAHLRRPNDDEQVSRYQWAMGEYARIVREHHAGVHYLHGGSGGHMAPWERSALFSRLMSGKKPLLFPPPTTFHQPWYDVIELDGAFPVTLGGFSPYWEVSPNFVVPYLEYVSINQCLWGVASCDDAASVVSQSLMSLKSCKNRQDGERILADVHEALLAKPVWTVRFDPWPEYRLELGRVRRQGRRRDIEGRPFNRNTWDGTNPEILRVVTEGVRSSEGKAERVAHLRDKPAHLLTSYERKVLAQVDAVIESNRVHEGHGHHGAIGHNDGGLDWVEYEVDGWKIQRVDVQG